MLQLFILGFFCIPDCEGFFWELCWIDARSAAFLAVVQWIHFSGELLPWILMILTLLCFWFVQWNWHLLISNVPETVDVHVKYVWNHQEKMPGVCANSHQLWALHKTEGPFLIFLWKGSVWLFGKSNFERREKCLKQYFFLSNTWSSVGKQYHIWVSWEGGEKKSLVS